MIPPCPEGTRSVVFVGPSLAAERLHALIPPRCAIAPPVRFGDLYALIGSGIETALIIDGVFHGHTPVWQREILAALEAGIRVVGAASMGALRALELAPYGMLGLGTVVAWYRDGRIEGDDEVALMHADAEMGYRALTLPLVDIRFALEAAVTAGDLPGEPVAALLARLKQLGHVDRSRHQAMAEAGAVGLDPAIIGRLLGPGRASVKALDAERALRALHHPETLSALAETGTGDRWDPPQLPPRDEAILLRAARAPDGRALRIGDILHRSTADMTETARRLREASRRWFLADWAMLTGKGPDSTERDALAADWLSRQAAAADQTEERWLRASALTRAELPELLRGYAVEAWLMRVGTGGAGLPTDDPAVSPIPLAILDWADAMGIAPPPGLAGTDQVAAWIVATGPAGFGFPGWSADAALARMLQLEGVATAEILAAAETPELIDAG